GNHQRSDAVAGQDFGGDGAKCLAEKTGIAANDYARVLRVLGLHVARDSMNGTADVFESKLLGHYRPPSGCAKLDLCSHGVLVPLDGRARLSAVPYVDFFSTGTYERRAIPPSC